jgi:hypothetical protein
MTTNLVLVLSDVSVGYGSPQILSVAKSLADYFSTKSLILEPDQAERPPYHPPDARVSYERVYTLTHPYSWSGHIEYGLACAEKIDALKPDVVVLCAFAGAGALSKMRHRPKLVIYYGIEHSSDGMKPQQTLMRSFSGLIDLCIFPEENRAVLDAPRLGLERTPKVVVYNVPDALPEVTPVEARNGRAFYGGTIHPTRTYGDSFLNGALDRFPIDMFGNFSGYDKVGEILEGLVARASEVTYGGYLKGGSTYLRRLSDYSYSIVIWNPEKEDTLYAAPNKFFDAIGSGVPPISAPHPMCRRILMRYRCGVLLRDWSLEAMEDGLEEAMRLLNSHKYDVLVENCVRARAHLNWNEQFKSVAAELDRLLSDDKGRVSKSSLALPTTARKQSGSADDRLA